MHSSIGLFSLAALATLASAATYRVNVGKTGLTFSPNNTVAAVGDIIEFHFYPKNHTVTQGSFKTPCAVGTVPGGAFFSGFVPTSNGEAAQVFRVNVNDLTPIWFFCSQSKGNHCQSGMVGSVNAPAKGNTLAAYAGASKLTKSSEIPSGGVKGGAFAPKPDVSSSTIEANTSTSAITSVGSSSPTTDASGNSTATSTSTTSTSTASTSTASTSASAVIKPSNGVVSLRSFGWAELLGLTVAVGGAAVYMG